MSESGGVYARGRGSRPEARQLEPGRDQRTLAGAVTHEPGEFLALDRDAGHPTEPVAPVDDEPACGHERRGRQRLVGLEPHQDDAPAARQFQLP